MKISINQIVKYIGVLLLALILVGQSFGQHSSTVRVSQKNTLIGGLVTEPVEGTVQLHVVENYITRQEKIYKIPLSDVGEFRFEFPLEKTTLLRVSHNGQDLDVYLEPGDAIKIISEGSNLRETVAFEGKAALHNEYLNKQSLSFANYSDNVISAAIIELSSLGFRKYMDKLRAKKNLLLEEFIESKEESFSDDFKIYAYAAIDYWWAYHLMRYRTEHPAGNNLSIPMTLPTEYYDFLWDVELSNDAALINQDYLYFLDLFLDFAKENPREWQEISQGTDKLLVRKATKLLLNENAAIPVFMNLDKGKSLHIVDKRLLNTEKIDTANFYKVEAYGGLRGWISGAAIAYSNLAPEDNEFTQTREVETSFMERFILGRFHRTEIRELPHENKVLGYLSEGEEAEFLLNQTTEKFRYKHFGALYLDYWYQIKTKDGLTGWVFRGGVDMRERKVTTKEIRKITLQMSNAAAKANLNGQTLFYALAKDLYRRSHTEEQGAFKTDVVNFLRINPIDDYDKTVQLAYENALRRRAGMKTTEFAKKEIIRVSPPPSTSTNKQKTSNLAKTNVKAKKKAKAFVASELPEINNLPTGVINVSVDIKGKITNANRRKIQLTLFLDPITYKEERREVKVAADGTFSANFQLSHGVTGEIVYGNKIVEIFVEPGDDLQLSFDAVDFQKTVVFNGKGQENNNYLKEMAVTFASQEEEMRAKLKYANEKEFSAYLEEEVKIRQQFVDRYFKKFTLSEAFLPIAKTNITYWRASNLLNYTYEHPLYHNQPAPMSVSAEYYDFLKDLNISEKGGLPAKNYVYFLQQYLDYLALQPQNQGKTQHEITKENLRDEAYYHCTAKLLHSACRRGNLAEAGKAIQTFIAECPYSKYSNVLRFSYNEAKGLVIGTKAPDFELTDIDGKTVHLSDFKGKLVYMDFWATWCAPCRRYMPNSQALPENFPKDKVVFLYISLDDNKSDWENYVRGHGLEGTHVCAKAGHGYHSKIAELYKVKSLPSYFLIDQEGRIAESPAANPASSKIIEQIRALLLK